MFSVFVDRILFGKVTKLVIKYIPIIPPKSIKGKNNLTCFAVVSVIPFKLEILSCQFC